MKLLIAFLFGVGLLQCGDQQVIYCPPPQCSEHGTVVDFTGTDGCGLLLELPDGKRLIPLRLTYIQAPTPDEDPIYHFDLKAGEKVYFSYKPYEGASACMMGDVVFVTCIMSATQQ